MANRFRQFRLLLWKNFILQIRRPIGTVFEILLPILLIAVLILPKLVLKPKDICFASFKPEKSLEFPMKLLFSQRKNLTANDSLVLTYYPTGNPAVASLMNRVSSITKLRVVTGSVVHKRTWTSAHQMVSEASEHEDKYIGAVVFDVEKGKSLPKVIKYSIRLSHTSSGHFLDTWLTERTYPNFQSIGAQTGNFYTSRFVPLQYAVDMAIIQAKTNLSQAIPLNVQQLPYPGYVQDLFVNTVSFLLPLLITIAFCYSAISMVKELVFEKQNRLKESMKMMGLSNWVHWAAWFTKCLFFLLVSIILVTVIVKVFKIFEFSNGLVIFLFFVLYIISSISYCFFISVFFSNPILSMLFGSVLWFAALVPLLVFGLFENYDKLTQSQKAALCLLPNSCVGIGARVIARMESLRIGINFGNLAQSPSTDDQFSLALVFGMMISSSVMFLLLTWYIEGVFPGEYGIPKPFYFPFQKSYWCGYSHDNVIEAAGGDRELDPMDGKDNNPAVEDEPTDLQVGVKIKNLRKVFKGSTGSKVAVDGLSLNMFKGQITALLGHNGAGKTTTMSVLTGLYPPSSGSATIDNKSILTDIDGIRESLGLCPQHNVLFDRLTVKEHLEFFINLKGKYGQAAKDEVLQMITDLQLVDKKNAKSTQLSGGMKRKLSIMQGDYMERNTTMKYIPRKEMSCAIALVGGSETVFLDEPTSGMDPYARRATWDLLLKYKANKTLILTTHFMDEADFLGDRIAIMADGQLRCCGSSLFLKSRYGVGYHLTLVKAKGCEENAIINAIKRVVPSAEVISNVGAEIEFVLNSEAAKDFEDLFLDLETKKEEYGIASFGVSVTTMEEVFMKVGKGSEKTVEDIDHEHHKDTDGIINISNDEDPDMGELQTGISLKCQQYKAMFMKRFLNSKRDKKAVATQIILPVIMVLFGLLIVTSTTTRDNDPPRLLKLSNLSLDGVNSKAFFADFRNSSTSQRSSTYKLSGNYLKTVKVDLQDVTDDVNTIHSRNMFNSIFVRGSTYNYSATDCCKYEFLILNAKCQNDFMQRSLKTCSSNKFGYKHCESCLVEAKGSCKPQSVNSTNPKDMSNYFIEYVLEKSNAKDYFNKHVAGFTIGPPVVFPSLTGLVSSNVTNATNTTKIVLPELPSTSTTVWYSNQAYHTIAESLNAFSNILLTELMGDTADGIEATNYPLPNSAKNKASNVNTNFLVLFMAIFLSMGMAFMAASFITFVVQEKASKAKHLQFVSGVDAVSYWLATYTWDFLNYLIPCLLILIVIAAFQVEAFNDDLGAVFLLLLLFGFCVLPFIYCMSYAFKSPLVAYAITVFVLSILSLAMLLTVFICRLGPVGLEKEADIMHFVFMLFPTYTISYSLIDMTSNYGFRKICTQSPEQIAACSLQGIKYTDSASDWERPGVGQALLFMFIEAIVLFLITLLLQVNFFITARVKLSANYQGRRNENEDVDVSSERTRINNLTTEQINKEAVVVRDLTKVYRGSNITAVDHICMGIPRGECFGLLGINGAGKTTTFSMLTGDAGITEGIAYLDGYDIQTHLRQVQQRIGYCPQFDALIERMTGREMLTMYARLRGVQPTKIKDVVSATIEHLSLGKWADKLCGDYSGGNKRKLSTAIALVGNPPIVFLDEPTTGMDPVARRFLWDSLTKVMKGGRSIVLTSHSMEECEALCTRLAIMVNGQFKCIGSPQHIKSRFGLGYTLMIKVTTTPQPGTANTSDVIPVVPPSSTSPASTVYENPVATEGLPNVQGPGYPAYNPAVSDGPPRSTPPYQVSAEPFNPQAQPAVAGTRPIVYGMDLTAAVQRAQSFVHTTFPGAQLLESHNGMLTYQINSEELTWSRIFGQLEKNRKELNIIDYSVSQTSLEQVFINLAKEQHAEERTKVKKTCGCCPC